MNRLIDTLRAWSILAVAVTAVAIAQPIAAQEGSMPPGTGEIAGRVVNTETGAAVATAQVVISGTQSGTLSTVQGRYLLRGVPAGTHSIQVTHLGHAPKTVTGVVVTEGETVELDISLEPQAIAVAGIEVSAAVERGNTVALLNERQRSATSLDAIGREQMSRTPDGDAAEALKRVPGLSVVDGKFAYIRGLGERYSSTSLNGAPLASPVPDKNVIPLDMFPTDLLESVVTSKSYSADKPGDYAGGHVELRTRDFPAQREVKVSVSSGYNTVTTFSHGLGYIGGGLDFLGFDDGLRELPASVPRETYVRGSGFTAPQLEEIGEDFAGDWGPRDQEQRPPVSVSASLGDEARLFDRRLGYVASLSWSDSPTTRGDLVERQFVSAGLESPEIDYTGSLTTQNVSIGALFNGAYELAPNTEIRGNFIYSRMTEDEARVYEGFNLDSNTDLRNTRIRFLAQNMFNGQLEGTHLLEWAAASVLNWRAGYTRAERYEPNTREVLYRRSADGVFRFDDFVQSGSRFYQELADSGFSGALDLEMPFTLRGLPGSLKLGASVQNKDRDVYTRRFRFDPGAEIGSDVRALSPNELLVPQYIGPGGFELRETTFNTDNYAALDQRMAGFVMADFKPHARIRAVVGARVEQTDQEIDPRALGASEPIPGSSADLSSTDVLPSVNLTFEVADDLNLRMSGSRTLALPQLRELAPFNFADYAGGSVVVGNPNLTLSTIDNADVRLEWFFRSGAIASVSAFYKRFTDPIEVLILPSTELLQTWVNMESAENLGLELEFRTDLGLVAESLESLSLNANLTLVDSEVTEGSEAPVFIPGTGSDVIGLESGTRALQGQSPYVANLGLTWAPRWGGIASVLFNRFGERIDAVGGQSLGAQYERARSQLDLVFEQPFASGWSAKISASRLLGNVVEFEQEGDLLRSYDLGRSVSLSFSWEM